ncbi:MAG: helix-turn-helix domain-containing protein [Algicola sp.]|nr:helix-turn-helix domain-containing protein [Algicola sp.]
MTMVQRQEWAKRIVARMMSVSHVTEKKRLAQLIGCHQNMPSNWIQQGSVPWKVIYDCHKQTGASLDWLYDGIEPSLKISGRMRFKLENLAMELMQMGHRLELIEQTSADGFRSVAKIIAKDVARLLSAQTTQSEPGDE